MLDPAVLLTELQRFADPSAAVFEGWPTHRVAARHRWANAFRIYVEDAVDTVPVLEPPAVSLRFEPSEPAFFEEIELDNSSIETAATDLADAWRSAIQALEPGLPAADSSSNPFVFTAMDPTDVATRYAALRATLIIVLRARSATRRGDLDQIAQAFHVATSGLRSVPGPFAVTYG